MFVEIVRPIQEEFATIVSCLRAIQAQIVDQSLSQMK